MKKNHEARYEFVFPWYIKALLSNRDKAIGLREALKIAPAIRVAYFAATEGYWDQFLALTSKSWRLRRCIIARWGHVPEDCAARYRFALQGVAIARSINAAVAARRALQQIPSESV